MRVGLGLDVGGSATRWAMADAEGTIVARGEAPAFSGLLFAEPAIRNARTAIAALAEATRGHGRIGGLLAGVTGSGGAAEDALLGAMLAEAFGLAPEQARVCDDLWIAHRARFAPGTGILVYSGTGSAAVHVQADGSMLRAGGHGYLIGDAGSGYAIARDAVRALLRAEDERPGSGWNTPLGRALASAVGGASWEAVRAYVYSGMRVGVAALAPSVAEAARAGDATAQDVLRRAGVELAALADVLLCRAGAQPVALAGGGARLHPLVHENMQANLGRPVGLGAIDAAAAAARLATGQR